MDNNEVVLVQQHPLPPPLPPAPPRPLVLRPIDEQELFEDTPLHEAASSADHIRFAKDVMNLMPSFARKLNRERLSPMHIALQSGNYKLVLFLLATDPELVRVKGPNGMTPLHCAAEYGYSNLVSHFLLACPSCIEDVNLDDDTVVHIAVKNGNFEVARVIVGWLARVCHKDAWRWNKYISAWRNDQGCTALDIAKSNDQTQVVKLLTRGCVGLEDCSYVGRGEPVARYLRSKISFSERFVVRILRQRMNISDRVENALLIVTGVMVAASYQIVYNPLGGFKQTDDADIIDEQNNDITLPQRQHQPMKSAIAMDASTFGFIATFNSVTLVVALCIILFLLSNARYLRFIIPALVYLLYSYSMSLVAITPKGFLRSGQLLCLLIFIVFLLSAVLTYALAEEKLSRVWYYTCNNFNNMRPEEEKAVGDEIQARLALLSAFNTLQ